MSKMTKQRKLLIGVLVLGVGAVVIDRAVLGGPEEANASDAALTDGDTTAPGAAAIEPVAATDVPAEQAAPAGRGPIDLSDFARRLEGMPRVTDGTLGREDVFVAPVGWQPQLIEEAAEETEPVVADGSLGRAFQGDHTHDGVIKIGETLYALVDGAKVTENQILDGFILIRFNTRQSLWESTLTGEFVLLPEKVSP
ncbi:hypothetical protein OT109_14880 [Phycisphaeraceae bacterium D3-23]